MVTRQVDSWIVIKRVTRGWAGPPSIPADAQASVEEYLLRDRGLTALVGTVLAAGATCVLLWSEVSRFRLLAWTGALALSGVATVVVASQERLRRPVDRRGSPWAMNVCAAWSGVVIGALVWVGSPLMDDGVTRMTIVALLIALSAGAVAGRAGVTGHGAWTFIPMAVVAVTGFAAAGQSVLAWLFALYALFMVKNLSETIGMLQEIIVLREQARQDATKAEHAAGHDPLTGLLNRSAIESIPQTPGAKRVTALFVDLDHFKSVNDRFGHGIGDELLVAVADRLRNSVRSKDTVARLGGDEFLILSNGLNTTEMQDRLAQRIVTEMERPFMVRGHEIVISASVGLAVSEPGALLDLDDLQLRADHALYLAKEEGRSQSVRFDERLRSQMVRQAALAAEIGDALDRNEVGAWGQPVLDVETGQPVAVELLARWQRPSGSIELPADFLPALTDQGRSPDLGVRMLDDMATLLRNWSDSPTLRNLPLSLNASPRQLMDEAFVNDLCSLITDDNVQPARVMIELVDTTFSWQSDEVMRSVQRITDLGIGVIVDDFGRGELSVGPLLEFPVAAVKLSRQFVTQIGSGQRPRQHLDALVGFCGTVGVTPVAKGVEQSNWIKTLTESGVTCMQGYLFCKPLPLDKLDRHLRQGDPPRANSATSSSTVEVPASLAGPSRS